MKNELTSLITRVKKYIAEQYLIERGEHLLLAVSGGADSVALLGIMHSLAPELGICLSVAHFDHMTRTGESTKEALYVQMLCHELELPFYGGRAYEGQFAEGNFEAKAREARYAFLRQTAVQIGCTHIATAHQQDDQAETLLLHLLRGCGMEGLSGIAPKEGDLLRPLLCLSRRDTESFCRLAGLCYAQDRSNEDTRYLRNRLRLELMPQLKQINPQLNVALCRTADICRSENEAMQVWAERHYAKLVSEQGLHFEGLKLLPEGLAMRVLRLYCERVGHFIPSSVCSAAMLQLKSGGIVACAGGNAYLQGKRLLFNEKKELPQKIALSVNIEFNEGIYALGEHFYCEVALAVFDGDTAPDMLWLPKDSRELHWRSRRAGDKIALKGMNGHKSVKAIMNEAALPPVERASLPLLVQGERVLWLPFVRKAVYELPHLGEQALRIKIFCNK